MNDTTPTVKPLPTIPPYGDNAIEISNLTFAYRSDASGSSLHDPNTPHNNVVLQDMNLSLQTGSRCLLIGANGSGKSVRSLIMKLSVSFPPFNL
jgi:ABC-type multidrug transport system fused ATPase/permease subunit